MSAHFPISAAARGMALAYGEVVNVDDPQGAYRVQVSLHGFSGPDNQDSAIWARVVAPFAGEGHGAVMLPDVGHQVLVGFVNGDRSYPIVLGALYTGEARPPQEPVDSGAVKRVALKQAGGTQILMDESNSSEITLETSGGVMVKITDDGSKVEMTDGSNSMVIDPAGVTIQTGSKISIDASTIEVNASMVTVNAGLSKFSGVVQCDTLVTNTVVSSTYTPGAGNIW